MKFTSEECINSSQIHQKKSICEDQQAKQTTIIPGGGIITTTKTQYKTVLPTDWQLDERDLCDLEMLLGGGFAPLDTYLNEADYKSVLKDMRLSDGRVWPMPVVLGIPKNAVRNSNVHWLSTSKDSSFVDEEEGKEKKVGATLSGSTTASIDSDDSDKRISSPTILESEMRDIAEHICGSSVVVVDGKNAAAATPTCSDHIIKLRNELGVIVAELTVKEVYEPDIEYEKKCVVGPECFDENHPHAKYLSERMKNCYYISGPLKQINPIVRLDFQEYRMTAKECKAALKCAVSRSQKHDDDNGSLVVGFQTRNPMHRCHYELTKEAIKEIEKNNNNRKCNLLLTPAVGPTQPGDVPYHVRVRCYQRTLKHYKNENINVKMVLLPLAMRMVGPREALWHALIRRNYGCTHFIVGRDHAGPSVKRAINDEPFYGPYDAHKLLKSFQNEIHIHPIFGKAMVYVEPSSVSSLSLNTAGKFMPIDHVDDEEKCFILNISGTELRKMLTEKTPIPSWYTFPDVAKELQQFYVPPYERGLCIYFTGLPCSGKSTLACLTEARLLESPTEKRTVTILDADVIRQHLSRGLGFSKEDRSSNVRRIGYVASEIVKHGGVCIVANIAPYLQDRLYNRQLIESQGGTYVEVYIDTPVSVCETRDIKELYKKAKMGIIKQFTGISDPYEIPPSPEVAIPAAFNAHQSVDSVFEYLIKQNLIL